MPKISVREILETCDDRASAETTNDDVGYFHWKGGVLLLYLNVVSPP